MMQSMVRYISAEQKYEQPPARPMQLGLSSMRCSSCSKTESGEEAATHVTDTECGTMQAVVMSHFVVP